MSDSNIKLTANAHRDAYELNRLKHLLNERNRQLHVTEQQISHYQTQAKHARSNLRGVMILAVIVICIISFGGNV